MKKLTLLLIVLSLNFLNAVTITKTDTVNLSTTNYTNSFTIAKFDDNGGQYVLESIEFKLSGHVEGDIEFESKDTSSATIDTNLSAMIQLKRPDGSLLITTMPTISKTDNVTAWDGTDDFGGTSGNTYTNVSADSIDSISSTTSADLALFTGTDDILLPMVATGTSSGNGAGNLLLSFRTTASSSLEVIYTYSLPTSSPVPEPSVIALFAMGLVTAWFIKK